MNRAYIEICKSALISNLNYYQNLYHLPIIAVIKANAYGHDCQIISKLLSTKVAFFAVATLEEALEIMNIVEEKILIFEEVDPNLLKDINTDKLIFTVTSINYFSLLINTKINLNFHLKVNTGMNRLGIDLYQVKQFLDLYSNQSKLKMIGLYTHYSSKNDTINENKLLSIFLEFFDKNNLLIHTGESILPHQDINAIRIGLGLFGLKAGLKQVIKIKSKISNLRYVRANIPVSYQKTDLTKECGYIYTIPLGYGDGWMKNIIPNLNDAYQIGPICMDYMMIFSKIRFPDNYTFEIINNQNTVLYYSKKYNFSEYEIVTHLNKRLKRLVID